MKVELFLNDINQDMIKKTEKLFEPGPDREDLEWTKAVCCVTDCCVFKSTRYGSDEGESLRGMALRKEEFGGLLWDSNNGRVYKLDDEAYALLTDLSTATTIQPVLEKYQISEDALREILIQVGRATEKC